MIHQICKGKGKLKKLIKKNKILPLDKLNKSLDKTQNSNISQ